MTAGHDKGLSLGQRYVLADDSSHVLVAAGAGSGKTRLLVAYFLKALLEDGVPLEGLTAVTFTRKAAGELLSRIREALFEADRPDFARSLESANIGTIHGLCSRLLRSNALAAGVDPAFSLLEAEAAALLREEVRAQVWSETVEQATETELEILAFHRKTFEAELLPLYERLRGLGMDQPALVVEPLAAPDPERARGTLRAAVKKALTAVARRASAGSGGSADLFVLEQCLAWLEEGSPEDEADPQAAAGDYARNAAGALEITRKFFPSRRTKALQEDLEEVRTALTGYRRSLAAMCLVPVVTATNDLLGRFHRRYRERKRDGGLLDYSDLELGARALLESQATDDAPAMGPDSRLMVDEFQDTNRLQCSIVDRLQPGATLMVGDERQSIYRFRGADVDVFVRRQAELLERAGDGVVHRLEVSYRARREVLEFINRLFAGSGFFGSLHRPLICGRAEEDRVSPDGPMEAERPARKLSPAVEILCAERLQSPLPNGPASTMQHTEAEAVADRVHRAVIREGWEPREIVILLPALTHVDAYQSALAVRGVPTYVVRGKGYYSREEISDMRSLLGVLVDPHDDLSLLALLRSPLVGLSDDTLLLLAREARRRGADSLWSVVRERRSVEHLADDQAARLREALSALEDVVACSGRPGLARLVDRAMTAFDYDLCLLAAPEGRRRFANIRKLMRLADEFESVGGPDLAGFVRLLDTVGDLSDDEGSAPTLAEDENVVRVMSIHQAKGLEFPLVVLAGLGSNSPGTRTGAFLIGHDGRMAVVLKDSRRDPYEQHDLALGPAEEIEEEEARGEREEDVRLLYVAMTRAQERLFLVGARPSGGLDGCRLGRIALALGLGELPSAGETWELEGLDALIEGVVAKPSGDDHPSHEGYIRRFDETSDEAIEVPDTSEIRPVFFEPRGAGAAVRGISYSSLAAYRRCPRRFYLERVLGLDVEAWRGAGADRVSRSAAGSRSAGSRWTVEQEEQGGTEGGDLEGFGQAYLDPAEAGDGREVGLLVHRLLEYLPLHGPAPEEEALRGLARDLLEGSAAALTREDVERAVGLTLSFWRSRFGGQTELAGAKKEASFMFLHREMMVSGVMDLVWAEDDAWQVVDYKTNRLAGRGVDAVGETYRAQASVYALALLLAGARAVSMHFLFLEDPDSPCSMEFGRSDISRLERGLDEALAGLANADFSAPPEVMCHDCPACDLCSGLAPDGAACV